jgi:hypothetical protein
MNHATQTPTAPTTTADSEPGIAIRRLAAAIALHAARTSRIKTQPFNTCAKPAPANTAKMAESLTRLPMT